MVDFSRVERSPCFAKLWQHERWRQVWVIVELLLGCVAARGSPCSAAQGVGLLEDGFHALEPAGRFCTGTAGCFLLAQNEVTTNQAEAGVTLALGSLLG